jgi:hypothetical protein
MHGGRAILAAILLLFVTVALVSSASSGFLSRAMSPKRLPVLGGSLCLIAVAAWLYLTGDGEYLLWAYDVPARPAAERTFVSLVENSMQEWSAETSSGERARKCIDQTAEMKKQSPPATDWTGTVATTYRLGTKMVLVARIGRYSYVGTGYNDTADAVLIDAGSGVFNEAVALSSGDPVRFSGSFVAAARPCMFAQDLQGGDPRGELVIRFTALAKQ